MIMTLQFPTMKIQLEDQKSLGEIQQEFSGVFPFLKIEFFTRPHNIGKGTEKKFMRSPQEKLKDVASVKSTQTVDVIADMTVAQLENEFKSLFGLHVQVFRRSGKLWLETTATDSWTLGYQNEQGIELSSGHLNSDNEPIDYHEQE